MFRGLIVGLIFSLFAFLFVPTTLAQESPKRVEVNLTNQRLQAFEGDKVIYDFAISSGKPWWPTPTGEFKPWIKLKSSRMQGGSRANGTYYNIAKVPNVIYFHNDKISKGAGYSIHGAFWHNNFGRPMSHGCVNVRPSEMVHLYEWMDLNTQIKIFGSTPS